MSESYPLIQEELSDVQRRFVETIERRLEIDPPHDRDELYTSTATYRNPAGNWPLPGDGVRFSLCAQETDDVTLLRHTVEFIALEYPEMGVLGYATHLMKRVESGQGIVYATESRFDVRNSLEAPELASRELVEDEVGQVLDQLDSFTLEITSEPEKAGN